MGLGPRAQSVVRRGCCKAEMGPEVVAEWHCLITSSEEYLGTRASFKSQTVRRGIIPSYFLPVLSLLAPPCWFCDLWYCSRGANNSQFLSTFRTHSGPSLHRILVAVSPCLIDMLLPSFNISLLHTEWRFGSRQDSEFSLQNWKEYWKLSSA